MTPEERFERAWNVGEVLSYKSARRAFVKEFRDAENDALERAACWCDENVTDSALDVGNEIRRALKHAE